MANGTRQKIPRLGATVMSEHGGFECMGYVVVCDNCGRRFRFPAADSLSQAIEDANSKGLVISNHLQFCNESCQQEHDGLICQHVWPRSGPNQFVCIKCGKHRSETDGIDC